MIPQDALNAYSFSENLGLLDSEDLTKHVPVQALTTRRQKLTRIFQIGFNKCGTRSLYRFLQRNGIHAAHFNRGMLAQRMKNNIESGRKPLNGRLNRYVGFTDLQRVTFQGAIEAITYYPQLYSYYPNSYFILNIRDKDGWITSRKAHGAGSYLKRYRLALGLADDGAVIDYWSNMWDRHLHDVQAFFKDKPDRLIVFDIKKDTPQQMVDFLKPDFYTKPEFFRHEGATSDIDGSSYATNKPVNLGVHKSLQNGAKNDGT